MCVHVHVPPLWLTLLVAVSAGTVCDVSDPMIQAASGETDHGLSLLQRRASVIENSAGQRQAARKSEVGMLTRFSELTGVGSLRTQSFFGSLVKHRWIATASVILLSVILGVVVFVGLAATDRSFDDSWLSKQKGKVVEAMIGSWAGSGSTVSDPEKEAGEGGATVNETATTLAKMMLGLGFVGLPKAMDGGWMTSPILFMFVVFLNGYTTQLIGTLMEMTKQTALDKGEMHDLAFLGLIAFGPKSRTAFSAFIIVGVWCVLVWALLLNSSLVGELFTGVGQMEGVVLSGLVFFVTTLAPLSWFARFSFLGIVSILIILGSLLWSAVSMKTYGCASAPLSANSWSNIPVSAGVFQSMMGGMQVCLPGIYRAMSRQSQSIGYTSAASKIREAISRGLALGMCIASFICLLGFTLYGSQAQASFVSNIGKEPDLTNIPGLDFLHVLCNSCLVVSVITMVPMVACPVVDASENALGIAKSNWVIRIVWKAVIVASATVAAMTLAGCLYAVQALIGTLFDSLCCLVWPVLCSLKLMDTSRSTKVFMAVILIYAAFTLIWGTYVIIVELLPSMLGGSVSTVSSFHPRYSPWPGVGH